jgi:hypothetical protein
MLGGQSIPDVETVLIGLSVISDDPLQQSDTDSSNVGKRPRFKASESAPEGPRIANATESRGSLPGFGPGFIVYLIKKNAVPEHFETTRKRKLREDVRDKLQLQEREKIQMELAYGDYKREEIKKYIAANYEPDRYKELIARKKEEVLNQKRSVFSKFRDENFTSFADHQVRSDLARQVLLLNFETFCEQQQQRQGSEMQPTEANSLEDGGNLPTNFAV